jgi:hypothetical protein
MPLKRATIALSMCAICHSNDLLYVINDIVNILRLHLLGDKSRLLCLPLCVNLLNYY